MEQQAIRHSFRQFTSTNTNMDANQAKQIADSLNTDNTNELNDVNQKIADAVYAGDYFVIIESDLSAKTIVDVQGRGFLLSTSPGMSRISWDGN